MKIRIIVACICQVLLVSLIGYGIFVFSSKAAYSKGYQEAWNSAYLRHIESIEKSIRELQEPNIHPKSKEYKIGYRDGGKIERLHNLKLLLENKDFWAYAVPMANSTDPEQIKKFQGKPLLVISGKMMLTFHDGRLVEIHRANAE